MVQNYGSITNRSFLKDLKVIPGFSNFYGAFYTRSFSFGWLSVNHISKDGIPTFIFSEQKDKANEFK